HAEGELVRLDARPPEALGERVRAKEHRRADDLVRVRVADAACVAAEQSQLQVGSLLRRDRLRDEPPEAGVDAVGVVADLRLEKGTRRGRSRPPRLSERRRTPGDRDVPDVRDRKVLPGQLDSVRHGASLDPPGAPVRAADSRSPESVHASSDAYRTPSPLGGAKLPGVTLSLNLSRVC